MRSLAGFISGALLFTSCSSAKIETDVRNLSVGDKMPAYLVLGVDTNRGKDFDRPNGNGKLLFLDTNGDGDYDLAAGFFKCKDGKEGLYGIYLRRNGDILYLDDGCENGTKPFDGIIDKVVRNPGKRNPQNDAPNCY